MPSRRALLALVAPALAGCAGAAPLPSIDDQPCPPLDLPEDRAVCSHTDAPGRIDVSVSPVTVPPAPESLEAVRLRVANGRDVAMRYDPARWRLHRDAGLGWREREGSFGAPPGVETMPPGGSVSWSGVDALFDLGAAGRTPPGLYAAVLPVWPGGGDGDRPAGASDGAVACVFLFRVTRD